jgi:transcriptional regulator NrdR family protein
MGDNTQTINDLVDKFDDDAKRRIGCHPANMRSLDEAAQAYANTVFDILTNGGDIKSEYGVLDKAKIAWAQVLEGTSRMPGGRKNRGAVQKERDLIEGRILAQQIKQHRKDFDQILLTAQTRQSYLRQRLEFYSMDEAKSVDECVACSGNGAELQQLLQKADPSLTRHKQRMASVTIGDFVEEADRYRHESMVALIQFASMRQQYQCVARMTSLIKEKGKYVDQVLTDYESGANIHDNAILYKQAQECGLIKKRLWDLNTECTALEKQMIGAPAMTNNELAGAYKNSLRALEEMEGELSQSVRKSYLAAEKIAGK